MECKSRFSFSEAKIINGTDIAHEIRTKLRDDVNKWMTTVNKTQEPKLVIILIGSDPADHKYVHSKLEAANEVHINCIIKYLSLNITEQELLNIIEQLNLDDTVDGILVQLPIPDHIHQFKISNAISCDKDVDGFNQINYGRLCFQLNAFIPCTALSVYELIKRIGIETNGKNCCIIGTSKNFGLPIAIAMHNDICATNTTNTNYADQEDHLNGVGMGAIVTMCSTNNTPSDKLKEFCRNADILITVANIPGLIKADMVKPNACVIDVGITRIEDENSEVHFVGDVDFEEVKKVAGFITPVPGGIGPVTITMLMKNVFKAAKILANKRLYNNNNKIQII